MASNGNLNKPHSLVIGAYDKVDYSINEKLRGIHLTNGKEPKHMLFITVGFRNVDQQETGQVRELPG